MTGNKTLIIVSTLIIFSLLSCKNNSMYNNEVTIPEHIWQTSDTLHFDTNISDDQNYYNLFLTVDAQDNYLTDNLWLFIKSQSPSGNILNDTAMLYITNEKGKWFGKKHGHTVKNKFLYKAHILFPEKGTYRFIIRHGMRKNDLPRVSSVGLSIEKDK